MYSPSSFRSYGVRSHEPNSSYHSRERLRDLCQVTRYRTCMSQCAWNDLSALDQPDSASPHPFPAPILANSLHLSSNCHLSIIYPSIYHHPYTYSPTYLLSICLFICILTTYLHIHLHFLSTIFLPPLPPPSKTLKIW